MRNFNQYFALNPHFSINSLNASYRLMGLFIMLIIGLNINVLANSPCEGNSAGISGPTTSCANEGELFIVNPPSVDASYTWTFSGPASLTSSTAPSVIVSWLQDGIYEVTLTVEEGACTNVYTHTIMVGEENFANAGSNTNVQLDDVLAGSSVSLGASPSSATGAECLWVPNLLLNNNESANPIANPPVTINYTLHTAKNGCVNSGKDMVSISVNP